MSMSRSKAQELVDHLEDNREETALALAGLNASRITSRIFDASKLKYLNLSGNHLTSISKEFQYLLK